MSGRNGYGRDLHPLPGEEKLEALSGLWDLVKPFGLSDVAVDVAAGATSCFVASRIGKGREGVLIAFAFDFEGADYTLSPVRVQVVDRDVQDVIQGASKKDLLLGPFKTQVGSLTQPFIMPFPTPIKLDHEVGLVVTNGSGQVFDASGMLYGISWSHEQDRDVRRALWGMRGADLWSGPLFTQANGGGR